MRRSNRQKRTFNKPFARTRSFVPPEQQQTMIQASKWKNRILQLLNDLYKNLQIITVDKITQVDPYNPQNYSLTLVVEATTQDRKYVRFFVHQFLEYTGTNLTIPTTYIREQDPENPKTYVVTWKKITDTTGKVILEPSITEITQKQETQDSSQ